MKRTVSLILTLCMLFAALAACNSTPSSTPDETQSSHIHSFGSWTVTKAATCTEAGQQERSCSCGKIQTQTIAITGHSQALDYTTVMATCTTAGSITGACKFCGTILETTVVPASHVYDSVNWSENEDDWNWTIVKEATCTQDGEKKIACTECGNELIRTIPATGHTPGEPVTENLVAATCTVAGSKDTVVYCTDCGDELSRTTRTLDAIGHTDTPICQHCGMNIREFLIDVIVDIIENSDNHAYIVYSTDSHYVGLGYSDDHQPILLTDTRATSSSSISTPVVLYLDDTDTLRYVCMYNSLYIDGNSLQKSAFRNSITGMSFDHTNIPTSIDAGVKIINNLKSIAAAGIKLNLIAIDLLFTSLDLPFTHNALGYTSYVTNS